MLGSILKGAAYTKAPRATFTVLHPRQAFEIAKLPYDLRHAYAPRLVALATLALALPAGVLLGRMLERRRRGPRFIDRSLDAGRSRRRPTREPSVA